MSFNTTTTSFSSSPPPVHSSSSRQNINHSVITAILVLSITVIVATSLCLLIRYITHRCRHRHSNTASVTPAVSQPPSSRRVAPETQDLSLLNSLPLFSFNSVTNNNNGGGGGGGEGNSDCAVCLSKFEPHDQLRLLPVCCHAFHADCVDTWLQSNQTCPLCRSQIFISDSEILGKILRQTSGSFRIEIGSVSSRQGRNSLDSSVGSVARSYSIGSFDYVVQDDSSEVNVVNVVSSEANKENQNDDGMNNNVNGLAEEVGMGSSRRWLRDYVDRFSSSFRSSGRFFGGSSRRHNVENWEQVVEVNRAGEEISEFFRWLSAV